MRIGVVFSRPEPTPLYIDYIRDKTPYTIFDDSSVNQYPSISTKSRTISDVDEVTLYIMAWFYYTMAVYFFGLIYAAVECNQFGNLCTWFTSVSNKTPILAPIIRTLRAGVYEELVRMLEPNIKSTYLVIKDGEIIYQTTSAYQCIETTIENCKKVDRAKYELCKWIELKQHEASETNDSTTVQPYDFIIHRNTFTRSCRIYRDNNFSVKTPTYIYEYTHCKSDGDYVLFISKEGDNDVEPIFITFPDDFFIVGNIILDDMFLKWYLKSHYSIDVSSAVDSGDYVVKVMVEENDEQENEQDDEQDDEQDSDSDESTEDSRVLCTIRKGQAIELLSNNLLMIVSDRVECDSIDSDEEERNDSNSDSDTDADADNHKKEDESDESCNVECETPLHKVASQLSVEHMEDDIVKVESIHDTSSITNTTVAPTTGTCISM
jgi:hypothetical protein